MNKRIMITGASGVGKTTIAKYISETYNIPFISTSAKFVWPKFGFKNHQDAFNKSLKNTKLGLKYQWEILKQRKNALSGSSFITDRSPIDNMAYFMMSLGHKIAYCETLDFISACSEGMLYCDGLIFIRWSGEIELEDDSQRINNEFFQASVDAILNWIVSDMVVFRTCPVLELTMWNLKYRTNIIDRWLEEL